MTNKDRTSRLLAGVLAGALMVALVACGDDDSSDASASRTTASDGDPCEEGVEPQPLDDEVSLQVNLSALVESNAHVLLAQELGEFERENLDVEITNVPSTDALPAVGAGQLDAAGTSVGVALFNAVDSGLPIRSALPLWFSNPAKEGLWVTDEIAAQGPEGLDGVQIASAVGPGSGQVLAIADYLAEGGLEITDVELVAFPAEDIVTAFMNGAVDAAWLLSPSYLVTEDADFGEFVAPTRDGFSGGNIVFGPTLLEDDRDAGEAFTRAIVRTVRCHLQGDYKSDPETVAALAEAFGQEAEDVERTPALVWSPDLAFDTEPMEDLQELWLQIGGLLEYSVPLPAEDVIDPGFIEAVLGDGAGDSAD